MVKKASLPSYCHHKATNQAFTRINGRQVYLGAYDSSESRSRYAEVVSDWSAGNLDKYGESVSVSRVSVAFIKYAQTYYLKDGKETSQMPLIRLALKTLVTHFGKTKADRFQPCHLEQLQQQYLKDGLARPTINRFVNIVRQAFRFAVTKGSVPPAVWQGLLAVRNLQKGRSEAKETNPVLPVSPVVVIATLRELGPIVSAMVRLQLVTGMRPGEVCSIRLKDIDQTGDVWRYSPVGHKTEHHGRSRVVMMGRKAQRILQPFLNRTEDSFLFSPDDPLRTQQEGIIGKTQFDTRYDRTSYTRAIDRAIRRAGVERWSPNRLRHTYATVIRKRYGLEAVQILLGHSKADTTQVYAERDWQKAEAVVREVG